MLTMVAATTITACNMQFVTKTEEGKTYSVDLGDLQVSNDVLSEIGELLEYADFSTETGVDALGETVGNIADEVITENEDVALEFQKAALVRVVDGDTIVVNIEGEEHKVRLIGVNTPESVAPDSYRVENTEAGVLASEYTKALLANVTEVYLQKDVSETDQYGRLLRYVWLEVPEDKDNINEIATKMLNGILVMDNVADPARYEPDTMYADDFDYIAEHY